MTNLVEKAKALQDKYTKRPTAPREYASRIINGKAKIDDAPEHLKTIIQDHIDTYTMRVNFLAQDILNKKGKEARLNAFKLVPEELKPAVKIRCHELKVKEAGA